MSMEKISLDLDHFYGTQFWYKVSPIVKGVITDGVKYVVEKCEAGGLMQDILMDIAHKKKIRDCVDDGMLVCKVDTYDKKQIVYEEDRKSVV